MYIHVCYTGAIPSTAHKILMDWSYLTKILVSSGRRGRVLLLCCLHGSGRPHRGQECPCISQRSVEWDLLASGLLQHASHSGAGGRRGTGVSVHLVHRSSHMFNINYTCSSSKRRNKLFIHDVSSMAHICMDFVQQYTHCYSTAKNTYMACTMTYRPPSRMLYVG